MSLSDVDLANPDSFVAAVPHEMFRVLRREAPVYFHPEPPARARASGRSPSTPT